MAATLGKWSGRIVDDVGGKHLTYDKRKTLLEMVINDPNQPDSAGEEEATLVPTPTVEPPGARQ